MKAFISYVRSVYLQKDKTVFKLDELPLDAFAASLGLAGAPKIKFVSKSTASQKKNAPRAVETLRKAPPAPAPASKKIESDREEETDEEASPESEEEGVVEGGDDDSSEDVEDEDGEQVAALPGPSKGPVNVSDMHVVQFADPDHRFHSPVYEPSTTECSNGRTKTFSRITTPS